MNRRLWTTVALTVALLGGISFLAGPAPLRANLTRVVVAVDRVAKLGDNAPWWLVGTIAGAALLAVGGLLWRERRLARGHAAPWTEVIALAKRGQRPLAIARATGLPQDVVRIVLAPVSPDSSGGRGNSFRPPAASDQPSRSDGRPPRG